jgi:hypothetical protein
MGVGATTMPGVPRLARSLSKVPSEHNTEHAVSACMFAIASLCQLLLYPVLGKDQYSRLHYRCTTHLCRDTLCSCMGNIVLASALATLIISYLYRTCLCIILSGTDTC